MTDLKQPLAGIVATVAVMAFSLLLISRFTFPVFAGWVAYGLMCAIPMQVVIAVLWAGKSPQFAAKQAQPIRGLLQILLTAIVAAIVGLVYFTTVGGGVAPPSPMLVQCTIVSVVITFWFAIIWGGWPFSAVIKNPAAAGLVTLSAAYVVNVVLFRIFFNYEFMQGAPVYVPSLDPHGMFNAWSTLVVYVTSLSIMFLMLHFDLWPLTKSPAIMKQPVLGLVWTAIAVLVGGGLFMLGTGAGGMDPVAFLVRVPIPFIFGTIVVLNMLQNSLFATLAQPVKGVANAVTAAVVGTVLARLYAALMPTVTGALASGPPAYEAEIWLASALLSVTFPFLIFHAEFLKFWPLKSQG